MQRLPDCLGHLALALLLAGPMTVAAQTDRALPGGSPPLRMAPAAHPARTFIVILQSSSNPDEPLRASIPAQFQNFDVFTAQRTTEGRVMFDVCLGHFASLADAEQAQRQLLDRFPHASIIPYRDRTTSAPASGKTR